MVEVQKPRTLHNHHQQQQQVTVGTVESVAVTTAITIATRSPAAQPQEPSAQHQTHAEPHNKRPTIVIYPTVSPETVVVPIISCILGFPLLALLVICCLRRRAKLAREQARRRNYEIDHGRSRAVSLRSERGMSRGFPSMELDTVLEERSDPDPEGTTVVDMITPENEIQAPFKNS